MFSVRFSFKLPLFNKASAIRQGTPSNQFALCFEKRPSARARAPPDRPARARPPDPPPARARARPARSVFWNALDLNRKTAGHWTALAWLHLEWTAEGSKGQIWIVQQSTGLDWSYQDGWRFDSRVEFG